MDNFYTIVATHGHFEAYTSSGKFVVSGDSREECRDDVLDMFPDARF